MLNKTLSSDYKNEMFIQMVWYIIYFWVFLISYVYLILYEQIHLEIFEIFSYCFKGKSVEINNFLDDSIYIRKRSRSLSEGSEPDSDRDEFLNHYLNEKDWLIDN